MKQHFIPRFLLKGFSDDEANKRTISLLHIASGKIIRRASLRDQAYGNNIYDSDGTIEKLFSDLESNVARILRDIASNAKQPSHSSLDHRALALFSILQKTRTPGAITRTENFMNESFSGIFANDPRFAHLEGKYTPKLNKPYDFLLKVAIDTFPMILDLKIGSVVNNTGLPFFLSDYPLVVCNPFLEKRGHSGAKSGIGLIGAILLLPFRKSHCLILYDSSTYSLTGFKSQVQASLEDVKRINQLQLAWSSNCTFFPDTVTDDAVKNLSQAVQSFQKSKKVGHARYSALKKNSDGGRSELLIVSAHDLPLPANFSFIGYRISALASQLPNDLSMARPFVRRMRAEAASGGDDFA